MLICLFVNCPGKLNCDQTIYVERCGGLEGLVASGLYLDFGRKDIQSSSRGPEMRNQFLVSNPGESV